MNSQSSKTADSFSKAFRLYDTIEHLPPFMLTRAEIERLLPAGSADKEQAIKCLEHSYSMYDDYGKHIPHIKEKENLFEVLDQRDTYIVDTNSQSARF